MTVDAGGAGGRDPDTDQHVSQPSAPPSPDLLNGGLSSPPTGQAGRNQGSLTDGNPPPDRQSGDTTPLAAAPIRVAKISLAVCRGWATCWATR